MITDLFASENIYLIREPVNGNVEIPTLLAKLVNGSFGLKIKYQEYCAIFSNSKRNLLIIFYKNDTGVGVFKWRLFNSKFKFIIDGINDNIKITLNQLKRLIFDGTIDGKWNNIYQQEKLIDNTQ